MKQVYFNEFNILMGSTTYFPLVSGLLRAFAESREIIVKNYQFMPFLFCMDSPDSILAQYDNPSVAAFSVSSWNEQLNLKVAKEVKLRWPRCLVVFGGPQIPHNPKEYFGTYSFIDVSVRGEGEEAFSNILERYLISLDFSELAGVSWRNLKTGAIIHNSEEQPFNRNLDYYPSPYLSGLYEDLMANNPNNEFQAIIETNRGCPFLCTFCYWGKGGLSRKYRFHGLDRVFGELEWCADHKIRYVFNADSNFGMHRRDRQIAEKLVELKTKYGFPEKFRTCYGKNTDEKIFEIGALFHEHDIEKGITLSRQSLNKYALKIVKRDNIKLEVYSNLQRSFNDLGVPVYCELILGLPGETFESWVDGIETLLETGIKNQIFIYFCEIYNNTELAEPTCRDQNEISTRKIEMQAVHGAVKRDDWVTEFKEIIVSTKTMNTQDWRRAATFSWTTLLLHSMKVGFYIIGYLRDQFGLPYTDFIKFISDRKLRPVSLTMLDRILDRADKILDGIFEGKGKESHNPAYGEIYWEYEEMSFLNLSENFDQFYKEFELLVQDYLNYGELSYDQEELHEAITYQRLRLPTSEQVNIVVSDFEFNFPEYFERRLSNSPVELHRDPQRLRVEQPDFRGDRERYAREVILWGRKSGLIERKASWKSLEQTKVLSVSR